MAMHTCRNLQFCRFRLTFQRWNIHWIDLGARDWKPRLNPVYQPEIRRKESERIFSSTGRSVSGSTRWSLMFSCWASTRDWNQPNELQRIRSVFRHPCSVLPGVQYQYGQCISVFSIRINRQTEEFWAVNSYIHKYKCRTLYGYLISCTRYR